MTTDDELTTRVAGGDAEAIAQLYARFAHLVYRLASRIVRDPGRADDVVQATFVQVLQHCHRLDATRGSVAAWILTIARSRAIDSLRAARAYEAKIEPFEDDDDTAAVSGVRRVEDSYVIMERAARLRRAVNDLPVPQRLTVELAFYWGLTHAEVAAALRQPLGTVKTRIRLAMERLRRQLASPRSSTAYSGEPSPFRVALAEYLSLSPSPPARRIGGVLTGVRVLVVDDDPDTLELTRVVLESSGAMVIIARSAADALRVVHATWPDVLVADLGMPGEDGYSLLRRMNTLALSQRRRFSAVAFTARTDSHAQILDAGFATLLRKPIEPSAIVDALVSIRRCA